MGEEWTEEEYEEEAKRLDWTVPQLKEHIKKEERIKKTFESWKSMNNQRDKMEINPFYKRINQIIDDAESDLELMKEFQKYIGELTQDVENKSELEIRAYTTLILYFSQQVTFKLMVLRGINITDLKVVGIGELSEETDLDNLQRRMKKSLRPSETGKYVVRLYDGFDNEWIDVSESVDGKEALRIWSEKTENGTKKVHFDDIDYYDIFPDDTVMFFSEKGLVKNDKWIKFWDKQKGKKGNE